ncbi:MAG TPA: DUF1192 family protein [Alphaproteobacteria bacterium]|nr:DUF1192 family protein [Alphaproteobacteria bacterium]
MNDLDLEPPQKAPKPKDLSTLSIAALEEYVLELETEISRARGLIAAKKKARGAADAAFKK